MMLLVPHWNLKRYMHLLNTDENGKKRSARLPVLIHMILSFDANLRCYPSTDVICRDTGLQSMVVNEARQFLLDHYAMVLVPHDKRQGKEKQLPTRQFVYQGTGFIQLEGEWHPYLLASPEIAVGVLERVLPLVADNSPIKVSLNEILLSEISLGETKDSSIFKGSTTKKTVRKRMQSKKTKEPTPRQPDHIFNAVALVCFGIPEPTPELIGKNGGRIGKISNWLKDAYPGATPKTVEAFGKHYDSCNGKAARPRDLDKFKEHFLVFHQHSLKQIELAEKRKAESAAAPNMREMVGG